MALKAKLTADEHKALPAVIQEHYVKDGEAFILDAEGREDAAKLAKALESERTGSKTLQQEIAKLKDQFKDLDPVKAREALAKLQELDDKKLLDAGEIDKLIAAKTERMVSDHTTQLKAKDDLLAQTTADRDRLQGSLKQLRLHGTIKDLATKKGVKPEAIVDAVSRFTSIGVDGTVWDLDGDKIVAKKGDQVRYGKDASQPMTIEEGYELLLKEAPHMFEPSTGSGAQNGQARIVGNQSVITADQARDPQMYQALKAAAEKAGRQLSIAS